MALILSLETSATSCSVALHDNGQPVNVLRISESQAHAEKLAVLIREVVSNHTGSSMADLVAVAVSSGPGSYTGLRIGTSTAKGICYALDIPLIAVNTLDLLCAQFLENRLQPEGLLCPMIDAKRMEVYCQIADRDLKIFQKIEAKVIDSESFSELLKDHKMFFFGDGAEKCKNVISHENAFFVDGHAPDALTLGKMAFTKFSKNDFEDLVGFTPLYLKDFVAKKAPSVF
jgi:tRNA threonylcarbamoyladenosine biosynthesis protein TsaB